MTLTLDDLLRACDHCKGTGAAQEEPTQSSGGPFGRRVVSTSLSAFGSPDCQACKGVGKVPTESGEAVIELLRVAYKQSPYSTGLGSPTPPSSAQ